MVGMSPDDIWRDLLSHFLQIDFYHEPSGQQIWVLTYLLLKGQPVLVDKLEHPIFFGEFLSRVLIKGTILREKESLIQSIFMYIRHLSWMQMFVGISTKC